MIEGGAHVISSCLHARKENGEALADVIIVTVAPMEIGDGVAVLPEVGPSPCSTFTLPSAHDSRMKQPTCRNLRLFMLSKLGSTGLSFANLQTEMQMCPTRRR
jgi:hypothetical protein